MFITRYNACRAADRRAWFLDPRANWESSVRFVTGGPSRSRRRGVVRRSNQIDLVRWDAASRPRSVADYTFSASVRPPARGNWTRNLFHAPRPMRSLRNYRTAVFLRAASLGARLSRRYRLTISRYRVNITGV